MTNHDNWTGDDHENHDDDEMVGVPNWSARDIDEDGEEDVEEEGENDAKITGEEKHEAVAEEPIKPEAISDFFPQVALYNDEEDDGSAVVSDREAEGVSFGYIEPLDDEGFPLDPEEDEEGEDGDEGDEAHEAKPFVTSFTVEEEDPVSGVDFSEEADENEDHFDIVDDDGIGEVYSEAEGHEAEDHSETHQSEVALTLQHSEGVAGDIEVLFGRWLSFEKRYHNNETFKTALVLPVLTTLGYDVYDPREVEPVENAAGAHEGYRVSGPNGSFAVLLTNSDHDAAIVLRAQRSNFTVEVLVDEGDEGAKRRQVVITADLKVGASAAGLERLQKDGFDEEAIVWLASQLHGNQEHILEAMKTAVTNAGAGFIADVRELLEAEGHTDLDMLEQRVALLAPTLFAAPAVHAEQPKSAPISSPSNGGDEEDDGKSRSLTALEQQAFEIVRDLCGPEIPADRIFARPAKTYVAVLVDDNNRRTIARLHFNAVKKKYLGVFAGKDETKVKIDDVTDISEHAENLRKRAAEIDPDAFA